MGTRSLIEFYDSNELLCTVYSQYDGYPTGMGSELQAILGGSKIVNGYSGGQNCPEYFNGIGCLAAYVIGKLKNETIGGIYLATPFNYGTRWIEYVYKIKQIDNNEYPIIEIYHVGTDKTLYEGIFHNLDCEKVEIELRIANE
jgi:hypothetical protein